MHAIRVAENDTYSGIPAKVHVQKSNGRVDARETRSK
jgi:hypothetical protein